MLPECRCLRDRGRRLGERVRNPVDDKTICTVALLIRSKASLHASAGGHLSIRSPRTEVAASTVKSTSSSV